MLTIDLPAEGRAWRPSLMLDVGHHGLGLDRGLDLGEVVLGRCLDDVWWALRVDDIEFGLSDTRYLLCAMTRVAAAAAPRGSGRMLTTREVEALVVALGREMRSAAVGEREVDADAAASSVSDQTVGVQA